MKDNLYFSSKFKYAHYFSLVSSSSRSTSISVSPGSTFSIARRVLTAVGGSSSVSIKSNIVRLGIVLVLVVKM